MPPYQNESLHDMHALMQQLDTLNAGHAPEHLEMFEGMKNAAKSMYKKGNDLVLSNTNRATEEEVILYEYSKDKQNEDNLNLLLMSGEIRAKFDELLKDMVKSPTFKTIIMNKWYPQGIPETKQREVYAAMHPPKT